MELLQKVVPVVLILIFILPITFSENKKRLKRRVVFVKDSKFFMRINGYEPIFNWSNVFGHGWGFKTTWNLPTTLSNRQSFFKRSLQTHHALLKKSNDINDYGCILWLACYQIRSIQAQKTCGIICQINLIIQRYSSFNLSIFADNCDINPKSCRAENLIF